MQKKIQQLGRRSLVSLATMGMVVMGAAFSGCSDSGTNVGSILTPEASAAESGSLTSEIDDIFEEMDLTEGQRSEIQAALAKFQDTQKDNRRPHRGPRHGGQPGDRPEPGDRVEHAKDRGEAVMVLVETVGAILTPAQTAIFVEHLSEKREEMRARMEERFADRRDKFQDRIGERMENGPLAELDLTDAQKEAMHEAMGEMRSSVRDVVDAVRAGTTSIEDGIAQTATLAKDLKAELAGILTAEQLAQLEEMKTARLAQGIQRRLDQLSTAMDRRVTFLTKVLHLDETQVATVTSLVNDTIPERKALLNEVLAGDMDMATLGLEVLKIERELKDDISGILTADQQALIDAVQELLPGLRF